jgi:hypothetical protein
MSLDVILYSVTTVLDGITTIEKKAIGNPLTNFSVVLATRWQII